MKREKTRNGLIGKLASLALGIGIALTAACMTATVARADMIPVMPNQSRYFVSYNTKTFSKTNIRTTYKSLRGAPLMTTAAVNKKADAVYAKYRKYDKKVAKTAVASTYKDKKGGWTRYFLKDSFIDSVTRQAKKVSGKYEYRIMTSAMDIRVHYNKNGVADKYVLDWHDYGSSKTGVLPPERYRTKTLYNGASMLKARTKANYVK